ncbi:MAG: hypothetical protein VB070_04265 [Clostridiaceae bacterium]|nr:hypothetical protein [Clostridiaceae bacterium]
MADIIKADLEFTREPLLQPFGFKGGYLNELWQVICQVEDKNGCIGNGLGVQSVLWSDAGVFSSLSQCGGNAAMLMTTQYALSQLMDRSFVSPPAMIDAITPSVYDYAKKTAIAPALRKTFALNAMVGLDFALWQLYAGENGIDDFETLTKNFTSSLTYRHQTLGVIPLITYGMPLEQIHELAQSGVFFFKIKLGQNPGRRNDPDEMLEADKKRILEVHHALKNYTTPYTDSGNLLYYFDANGRYDTRERFLNLLYYMASIDVLSRTVILEEPFPEEAQIPVFDLPVRIAGDESAHSPEDVRHLIDDLGYGAIALKPIAKTLSVTLQMLEEAHKRGIPCFCADLTVNPYMSDWNKNVACRLAPLPGMKTGVVECNGAQNYQNWQQLKTCHPIPEASWLEPVRGVYRLDDLFYRKSGGILLPLSRYQSFFHS